MAVQLSKKDLNRAQERLVSLRNRIERAKKEAEKTAEKFVRSAEVGGTAFAFGVVQGRTGGVEVVGVPIDLAVGVGLNIAGYMGAAGKMSDHLNNVGDGALAAYLTTMGQGVGKEWAKDKAKKELDGKPTPAVTDGRRGLTPEEIAIAAANARAAS